MHNQFFITPQVFCHLNTGVHSAAATKCMRWVFTGSGDGVIRKYDFFSSMNGKAKQPLSQIHPYVEPINKVCLFSLFSVKIIICRSELLLGTGIMTSGKVTRKEVSVLQSMLWLFIQKHSGFCRG